MSNTQRLSLLEPLERQVLIAGDDIEGRYVLKAKLGEGGMGVVFLARQISTNRDVALKVMRLDKVDETGVERFRQEIDIISGLSHPNIVRVFDTGRIPNRDLIYVVMELVEGISLNEVLWYRHAAEEYYKCHMDVGMALEIAYQVCAALTEPHMQGIIHRDIKPENLIIVPRSDETMHVKVLDFGVARVLSGKKRVTDTRIPFVGTPHYMAPEQVACSQYDARTDLYAVGVLLFELLCGQYPFDDENLLALLLRKTQYDAPSLKERVVGSPLPADVLALVHDLLARDPDKRPADALEVRNRIDDLRDRHPFKRIRLPTRKLLAQTAPAANTTEAVDRLRELFHPWLKLPSGRTVEEYLDAPHGSPGDPPMQAAPVEDYDEEADIPTNVVEPPVMTPYAPAPDAAPRAAKPVHNHMQAWHVAEGWTDSFDVASLKRDVHEMQRLFEGPTSDAEAEDIEESITGLYNADKLKAAIQGYQDLDFEDSAPFHPGGAVSSPGTPHHTPSPSAPLPSKPLQFHEQGSDMDPTIRDMGSVQDILRELEREGAALAQGAALPGHIPHAERAATTPVAFSPLYDERDDILTSVPRRGGQSASTDQGFAQEDDVLATTSQELPAAVRELRAQLGQTDEPNDPLLRRTEREPFVPPSFVSSHEAAAPAIKLAAKPAIQEEAQEEDDADDEPVDAFADTMQASADELGALALDATPAAEAKPPQLQAQPQGAQPRHAPRHTPSPAALGAPDALAPRFGAVEIDADEAQSLSLRAAEVLAQVKLPPTAEAQPSTASTPKTPKTPKASDAAAPKPLAPTPDEPLTSEAPGSSKKPLWLLALVVILVGLIAAIIAVSSG